MIVIISTQSKFIECVDMFLRLIPCYRLIALRLHRSPSLLHRRSSQIFRRITSCIALSTALYSLKSLSSHYRVNYIANCDYLEVRQDLSEGKEHHNSMLVSISDSFYTLWRIVCIFVLFTPPTLLLPLKYFASSEDVWWKLVLLCFQLAGPTFVKFGQWVSTRRDVFSSKFCDTLSILHSSVWIHPWEATEAALTNMLGEEWENTVVNISREPIGSGCVAQVHRGHFFIESEQRVVPVAIKVLHPNIHCDIETDLTVLARLAWLVELVPRFKWVSASDSVQEFRKVLLDQVDLTLEAKNLAVFNSKFKNVDTVTFPTPLWPFVSEHVLIETFHEGQHISKYIQHPDIALKKKLAKIGMDSLLKMLFTDNFVHIDLHPGNILVSEAKGLKDVSVTILDAGLAKQMAPEDFVNLTSLFRCVVQGKGREVATLMLERSKVQECMDEEKFREDMEKFVSHVFTEKLSLGHFQVSYILRELFAMAIRHRVKIESNFATIMLAIMIAEGIGRALDPDIDILRAAVPYLITELVSVS